MKRPKKLFAAFARFKRESRGLTQGDVAYEMGYKQRDAVSKLESDTSSHEWTLKNVVDFSRAVSTPLPLLMQEWQAFEKQK